ncbi:MAG: SUF system Fe-S cluster assembly protein [Acidobacteriota bacterium]
MKIINNAPPPQAPKIATDTAAEAGVELSLEDTIVEAIKTIYDPEIPVNIYELGLIYNVAVGDDGHVDVIMTLTSPACPVAGSLPGEVQAKVESVDGVTSADVEIVWDPVWNPSMMSEAARLELGML